MNDDDVLHARLVINDASLLTPLGRIEIAEWLRRQAKQLIADGRNYAPRYTATYNTPMFTEPPKKRK